MNLGEPWRHKAVVANSVCILASYRHWLGQALLPTPAKPQAAARALFEAPFPVLAHGLESDPILSYGNRKALELWEMDWAAFTRMPSRLTAEPGLREDRARLLADVLNQGYSTGYHGVRISHSGKRFAIKQATVWNLVDEQGRRCGQAATFSTWRHLGA